MKRLSSNSTVIAPEISNIQIIGGLLFGWSVVLSGLSIIAFVLTWLSEHGVYGAVFSALKSGLTP